MRQIIINTKWVILLVSLLVVMSYRCNSTRVPQKQEIDEEELLKEWGEWAEEMAKRAEMAKAQHATPDQGPKGWPEYYKAVMFLHQGGDRKQAAELFDKVVEASKWKGGHPHWKWMYLHEYTAASKDLAPLLRKMSEEDKKWKEPSDISKLPSDKQIDYYIHKLRDLAYLPGPPVPTEVFFGDPAFVRTDYCEKILFVPNMPIAELKGLPESEKNPAIKLAEIGKPAIPSLINLLTDRRPTRSIDWRHPEDASRNVIRYQDVALEIITTILDKQFGRYPYFSFVEPTENQKIIDEIKTYWEKVKDKP